ncbi:hypothetical protein PspLS_01606 [Pyricularia sp. CBS 133598]|nr:hypothetical protein PspLS_01606 [Pyricularia sp. CBS 133598]
MAWCHGTSPRDCARSSRRVVNVLRTLGRPQNGWLYRMDVGWQGCSTVNTTYLPYNPLSGTSYDRQRP